MRLGTWRGTPLRLSMAIAFWLSLGLVNSTRADGLIFQHTIPRETPAYDFTTGGPYYAPPVPYGHYAKDYVADAHKAVGCVTCALQGLLGAGGAGHDLFHKGAGTGTDDGDGSGHGHGFGHGGFGHGHNGFGGDGLAVGGTGPGWPAGASAGISGSAGYSTTLPITTAQTPTAQSVQSFCGQPGCSLAGAHSHLGGLMNGSHGGNCGDPNCGHGHGFGHGNGAGTGCSFCGGAGCSHCLSGLGSGLGSAIHGKLASIAGVFHRPKISWFLGAGGPVPLTPGYVPYIVVTRSPRDYFSFPPMNPNDP
jgi:hypothetical protein